MFKQASVKQFVFARHARDPSRTTRMPSSMTTARSECQIAEYGGDRAILEARGPDRTQSVSPKREIHGDGHLHRHR
jgi:hypothetical protein